MKTLTRALAAVLLLLVVQSTYAHRPSDAFLTLRVEQGAVAGQWEIALRDLPAIVDVDADHDGDLTWGELRRASPLLNEFLMRHLTLSADGEACTIRVTDLLINDRVDGRHAWFPLDGRCRKADQLTLGYTLLFDVDPTHRGILVLTSGGLSQTAVLSPARSKVELALRTASSWRQFTDYLHEGVHHIWIGIDHILFLVSLLLPCVLVRTAAGWRGVTRLRPALIDTAGIVTAFTLAHSLTLTLAALDYVRLPGYLIESAIAFSVILAALNNIFPLMVTRRWAMAFAFGLIHGFGFASVLGELGLPDSARFQALLAFNLGVELGQLSIVIVVIPLMYRWRNSDFYRRVVMIGASVAIIGLAATWLWDRLQPAVG